MRFTYLALAGMLVGMPLLTLATRLGGIHRRRLGIAVPNPLDPIAENKVSVHNARRPFAIYNEQGLHAAVSDDLYLEFGLHGGRPVIVEVVDGTEDFHYLLNTDDVGDLLLLEDGALTLYEAKRSWTCDSSTRALTGGGQQTQTRASPKGPKSSRTSKTTLEIDDEGNVVVRVGQDVVAAWDRDGNELPNDCA